MKRSEMINILAEDLLTMDGFLNYSYGGYEMPTSYTEIAETIIDFLIDKGMQPPAYFNKEFYDEPECDGMLNEWEPE